MSGRVLGYPHYIACALSSEPKLQAIRAVVLRPDFWVRNLLTAFPNELISTLSPHDRARGGLISENPPPPLPVFTGGQIPFHGFGGVKFMNVTPPHIENTTPPNPGKYSL